MNIIKRITIITTILLGFLFAQSTHGMVEGQIRMQNKVIDYLDSINGYENINVFGQAVDGLQTTATDFWDLADATPTQKVFLAPTAARVHAIVSTDATDVSGIGTLTFTGTPLNTETVTIGTKVYTYQNTLTNVDGNVKIASTQAVGTLTVTEDVEDTETVIIEGKTYTYQDDLTDVDGNVKIGSEQAEGILTFVTDIQDGETITLDTKVYTFQNTLTDVDGNVHIGSEVAVDTLTLSADIQNLDTVTVGIKEYVFENILTDIDGHVHIASEVGSGILTATTDFSHGETFTLGSKTYTFQNILTDVDGNVKLGGIQATGVLTAVLNANDGDTVTINDSTYTFEDTLTDSPNYIQIGANANLTLDNFASALNGGAGAGTAYGTGTPTSVDITAVSNGDSTLTVTSIAGGTVGNAVTTTDVAEVLYWGAATLENGTSDVDGTLYNFVAAIKGEAGAGTAYAASMVTHTTMTASASGDSTMSVSALIAGTAGNAYATTETSASASFGAATLENGTDDASGTIDNFIAAINGGAGSGTAYAASMTPSTDILAAVGAGDTMVIEALIAGTAGNSIAATETSGQASWSSATLEGGTDDLDTTITSFVAAIMDGAGSGTAFAASMTTPHTTVEAVDNADSTVTMTAILNGTAGNSIATTETSGQASFAVATLLGGTDNADGSITNLTAAINLGSGSGTGYAASMVLNVHVTATDNADSTMLVTSKIAGVVGNAYGSTETLSNGSWGAATLENGADDVSGSIDNLIAAINLGSGSGTAYAALTTAGADVLATVGGGDTMILYDELAVAIATTETLTNGSWGGATAPAGVGARTVRVYGLRTWDVVESYEDVALHGDVAVNTDSSYVIVNRMEVLTHGTTNLNVGAISATAATDATKSAEINVGEGETHMAIIGVPSIQTALISGYFASINDTSTVTVDLMVNDMSDNETTLFKTKHSLNLNYLINPKDEHLFKPYMSIAGPAIIKLQGVSSVNDIDGKAGFGVVRITD